MQLTGPEISKRIQETDDIIIIPFDERCLGSNSYDLHLADTLRVYKHTLPAGMRPGIKYNPKKKKLSMADWFYKRKTYDNYLKHPEEYDIRNPRYLLNPCDDKSHETIDVKIPDCGLILSPYIGYLGTTVEYSETHNLFPYIDGKSSVGRNFILNHHTAGRGDDGFCGQWTLEIRVLYPTVVFPYMRIGQIYYEKFEGERKPYNTNPASHYNNQFGPTAAAKIAIDDFLRDAVVKLR